MPFLLQVMWARPSAASAALPVSPFGREVDQHQVIVGAAGHELVAACEDRFGHRLGVGDDRMRVSLELGRQRLVEGDRLGGDDVHQRPALEAGKDRRVDLLGEVLVVGQDHAAARAAQGLVGGRGDDMGVRERRGMRAARDQPGEMGDVDDEIGADRVADRAEALEVPVARIGRAAGDDRASACAPSPAPRPGPCRRDGSSRSTP